MAVIEVTPVLVITPVPEVYEMPVPPESEVLEILLLKLWKSADERYPFCDAVPCCIERVLLEKVSGEEIIVVCTAPVAFPERIPERVLEPVPPRETASVPIHVGANVWVSPAEVMMRPRLVSEEVANVCVLPV